MSNHDHLREHLASLPEADVPERLWTRIDGARRRRNRRWAAGAGIAGLAIVLGALLPSPPSRQLPSGARPAAIATSTSDGGDALPAGANTDPRLRALDRDLQAAYRRNANETEIAALWATRRALLASRRGRPIDPVRI